MNTLTLGGGQEAGPLAAGSRARAKVLAGTLENLGGEMAPLPGQLLTRGRAGVSAPPGPSLARCPHTESGHTCPRWLRPGPAWGWSLLASALRLWATDPLVEDTAPPSPRLCAPRPPGHCLCPPGRRKVPGIWALPGRPGWAAPSKARSRVPSHLAARLGPLSWAWAGL